MRRLLQRLKEPFPDRSNPRQNFLSLLGVGLFVSLFLWIIQPFGIHRVSRNLIPICLGFGAVTVVFGWIYDLIYRYVLRVRTDVPSWTLGKWILQSAGLIVWIAIGNYLFMNFLDHWRSLYLWFLFAMVFNTLIVGIFPIVFSGLMIQMKAIKSNQQQAAEVQSHIHPATKQETTVSLTTDNSTPLTLAVDDLKYIEAMQNYISVYYADQGEMKKEVIRSTLSKISETLKDTTVIQCHRSFLVNTSQIEKVSGNAQGFKLQLREIVDVEIPVSRSFIPRFKELK